MKWLVSLWKNNNVTYEIVDESEIQTLSEIIIEDKTINYSAKYPLDNRELRTARPGITIK